MIERRSTQQGLQIMHHTPPTVKGNQHVHFSPACLLVLSLVFPSYIQESLGKGCATHSVLSFPTSINLRQLPQQVYPLAHQWRQSFIEILFPGDFRLCHWHLKVTVVLYKWNYLLKFPTRVLEISKLLYIVGLVISVTLYKLYKLFLMAVKCLTEPS